MGICDSCVLITVIQIERANGEIDVRHTMTPTGGWKLDLHHSGWCRLLLKEQRAGYYDVCQTCVRSIQISECAYWRG